MISFLSGGTGTPKLIQGFREIISDNELSIIANSADDIWIYGVYVSPDIDTILYLFSDLLDTEKYWGVKDETYHTLQFLNNLGIETWFNLGDKDLALHLLRTREISKGKEMSQIIDIIRQKLDIKAKIFPSTNNHIETRIITKDNRDLHFQEFWVKEKGKVNIQEIYIKNLEQAEVPKDVIISLDESDVIIIGPSNPITSIGPIVKLDKIRKCLEKNKDKCIAISPIIGKAPVSGPTGKLMEVEGKEVSPLGIATIYQDLCSTFVIHNSDSQMKEDIARETDVNVVAENILFNNNKIAENLASKILDWST